MDRLRTWCISLASVTFAVAISYVWLDKPIAYFAHNELQKFVLFERLTLIPEPFGPFAIVTLIGLGIWALTGRSFSRPQAVLLLCSLSLVVASAIKSQLKVIFGRTWPETWIQDNPSLIRDGVFGFNPFHKGLAFESFPSGHAAAICAVMSVLWVFYPKLRILYAICIAAVVIGLIGANYHFLSDIIAGGFVGASTGWVAAVLWKKPRYQ